MTTLYFATGESDTVLHASVIARNNVTRQSIVSRGARTGETGSPLFLATSSTGPLVDQIILPFPHGNNENNNLRFVYLVDQTIPSRAQFDLVMVLKSSQSIRLYDRVNQPLP